jgi:hypothetical protein
LSADGSRSSGAGRALALQRVRVALAELAIAFADELGAFDDAVFSGELFVAEADVGTNLLALEAIGAFAEVEVGILRFAFGDAAAARAIDGLLGVAGGFGGALSADFDIDGCVGAGDAAGFTLVRRIVRALAALGGIEGGRRVRLSKRAADAALEVIHEADSRLTLEGTRLDVLLGDFEAGEVGVVFVLGDARVADPAALTSSGQCAHGQYADQTKHAGQDRTGHQIVLLKAVGAPLLQVECASMTRCHVL